MTKATLLSGKALNKIWNVNAKHALYREDGTWYHQLTEFPGALFDAHGYIVFETKEAYENCKHLQIKQDLHIPYGIASIPGYITVSQISTIQDISQKIKTARERKGKYKAKGLQTPKIPQAVDLGVDQPSERELVQISRIIRDTELARWVKFVHEYHCQICGIAVELKNGAYYAEAHHIKPLGTPHDGPDVIENIICVCPNHHAQLDYGAIKLSKDMMIMISGHEISDEYINYHNTILNK